MAITFGDIPEEVITHVRETFRRGNDKVSRTISDHPSMHEQMLDGILITEITSSPSAYFPSQRVAVDVEAHWLGGRHMHGRWEIADIALYIGIRENGHLISQKIALLQTKRLYSNELPVDHLEPFDYGVGIGRLLHRDEPLVPISRQRKFRFDGSSAYEELTADSDQLKRIDEYMVSQGIPVFYGLYNPITLPYEALYPATNGTSRIAFNEAGCRVLKAQDVHAILKGHGPHQPLIVSDLTSAPETADLGWRLETFVADEVMRCRQGRLFSNGLERPMEYLLYERGRPITAAIAITVDFGSDRP